MLKEVDHIKIVADLLRRVSQTTPLDRNGDFILEVTKEVSAILGMRYCFVAGYVDLEKTTLRTIAFTDRGGVIDNIEYKINESACQMMVEGKPFFLPKGAHRLYNVTKGIEAYAGAPILNPDCGEVIGHIAVTDPTPHPEETNQIEILKVLAARLGAEFV